MTERLAWVWGGEPDLSSLTLQPVAQPDPGPGEVTIANLAVALNPADWKVIEHGDGGWQPGHIPGLDGVGRITAAGAGVTLPLGARVAYHQAFSRHGSFATTVNIAARSVWPVPPDVSDAAAAAMPCPGITAWQAVEKLPNRPNRDVLVTGAGGVVGLFLAQLAVLRGWRVWATAAPPHHCALIAAGISGVFDYREPDWPARLAAQLGDRKLFALFDTVSPDSAASLHPLLGYNGHIVCIHGRLEAPPQPGYSTALSVHEIAVNTAHHFAGAADWADWQQAGRELLDHIGSGRIRLPRMHAFDFARLPDALRELKRGDKPGKFYALLPAQ